jgi:hypothetical protein
VIYFLGPGILHRNILYNYFNKLKDSGVLIEGKPNNNVEY